jgi:hypothetical protein
LSASSLFFLSLWSSSIVVCSIPFLYLSQSHTLFFLLKSCLLKKCCLCLTCIKWFENKRIKSKQVVLYLSQNKRIIFHTHLFFSSTHFQITIFFLFLLITIFETLLIQYSLTIVCLLEALREKEINRREKSCG